MLWQWVLHMCLVQVQAVTAGFGQIVWERPMTADAGGNKALWTMACHTRMQSPVSWQMGRKNGHHEVGGRPERDKFRGMVKRGIG